MHSGVGELNASLRFISNFTGVLEMQFIDFDITYLPFKRVVPCFELFGTKRPPVFTDQL